MYSYNMFFLNIYMHVYVFIYTYKINRVHTCKQTFILDAINHVNEQMALISVLNSSVFCSLVSRARKI